MQIRIRGTRSLTATNDPLVVLDGIPFPGNISDIDMNDVRSVDVLKGRIRDRHLRFTRRQRRNFDHDL